MGGERWRRRAGVSIVESAATPRARLRDRRAPGLRWRAAASRLPAMVTKAPSVAEARTAPGTHPTEPYIVLVGLDLSEPGGRAWRFAFDLAALRGDDSEVHAVIVGNRFMAPTVRDLPT